MTCLLLLSLAGAGLRAQQALPASGGNASGTGGTVAFSVGQLLCPLQTGPGGAVLPGVQQPFEISVISGIENVDITLQCSVFPNPVNDRMVLKTGPGIKVGVACLFNVDGKLLKSQKIRSDETIIDMGSLAAAIYFLKVTQDNRPVTTFKIIRN